LLGRRSKTPRNFAEYSVSVGACSVFARFLLGYGGISELKMPILTLVSCSVCARFLLGKFRGVFAECGFYFAESVKISRSVSFISRSVGFISRSP